MIDDGRTLVLATDPHASLARYVLPPLDSRNGKSGRSGPETQAAYGLTGIEAAWTENDDATASPAWSGWLPALDSESLRMLSQKSKQHERGLKLLARAGKLNLSGLLRLPAGLIKFQVESSVPIEEALLGDTQGEPEEKPSKGQHYCVTLAAVSKGDPLFLSISLRTGHNDRPLWFKGTYRVGDKTTDLSLKPDQVLLPWAPLTADSTGNAPLIVPDLTGGDSARGKTLFFGDQARCSQCHAVAGQGGKIGPDLTSIGDKSKAETYRSIAAPSADIDPAYRSYTVATKDGQVVVGVVRADGPDTIQVTDTNARPTTITRNQIQQIRPSATSVMPIGLTGALGLESIRDLIAYLTAPRVTR